MHMYVIIGPNGVMCIFGNAIHFSSVSSTVVDVGCWSFVVLSRFAGTILITLKNAEIFPRP